MAMTRWHGPHGSVEGQLREAGHCHIFHENSLQVSESDLSGLPATWCVESGNYSCVELACGHSFHVSALAWHCVHRDMRCPMCRRGQVGQISVDSLPENVRKAFCRRLEDADVDTEDEGIELVESDGSVGVSDLESDTEPIAYEDYVTLERLLRMVVEVRSGAHEVFVYESPVRLDDSVDTMRAAMSWSHDTSHSMRCFRVQQSFTRHMCSKIASRACCSAHPVFVKFSLIHPLFRCGVESLCVELSTSRESAIELVCCGACHTAPLTVGKLHVNHASRMLRLALEPSMLVSLWHQGL